MTRRRTGIILLSVALLFFVHCCTANILDSPPPPLFNSSHFPNGGIDWSNIGFPDVSSDCLVELARMTGGGLNQSYSQMKRASGHELGDVGNWWNCTQNQIAQYCFISAATPNCALSIPDCNIGLCLPIKCTETDVENIAKQYFDKHDKTLSIIAHCGVEYSAGDWVGFTASMILIAVLTFLVVAGTTIWLFSTGDIKKLFMRVPQQPVTISPLNINESRKDRIIKESDDNRKNEEEEELEIELSDKDPKEEELVGFIMEDSLIQEDGDPAIISKPEVSPLVNVCDKVAAVLPKESIFVKVWKSFAVNYNFSRLLSPIPGEFGALNGLRFFNMLWIIWGHTLFFWAFIGSDDLLYAYNHAIHAFWIQTPINGVLGVDSFFFLSGFLVAYFLYERLIAGKSMQWFLIYFHRIWRIMPMYVVVMFLWAFLTPFLGEGPFWWQYKQIVEHTSPNCWSNLLFINNFYPPSSNDQCMGWGWFLAVDMQFYIFSPFLIYLQYKKPVLGWISLVVIASVDVILSFCITFYFGFTPSIITRQPHFFDYFYQKPYCRSSPYVIGMASAYIYSYIKRNRPNFSIPSFILNIGYFISFTSIFFVVYAIYWDEDFIQIESSIYLAFSRLIWGLSVGFLMITMFLGYGGILRTFFCLRVWQPLSKLTFGAYLVHPFVIGGSVKLFYRITGKDPSSLKLEDL